MTNLAVFGAGRIGRIHAGNLAAPLAAQRHADAASESANRGRPAAF